nr:MAG TPA: hypothetical protein [Caudoviricetes sp.]
MKEVSKKNHTSPIQKIGEYKMDILNRIVQSPELAKLLRYDTPDALFRDDVENPETLIHERVFPYRFMPDTVENQGTFITIGIGGFRPHENGYDIYDDYSTGSVYFYVFTHVDLMQTHNGTRQDLIIAELDKIFHKSKGIGMGELKSSYMNELWIHNNKFGGYTLGYAITDIG